MYRIPGPLDFSRTFSDKVKRPEDCCVSQVFCMACRSPGTARVITLPRPSVFMVGVYLLTFSTVIHSTILSWSPSQPRSASQVIHSSCSILLPCKVHMVDAGHKCRVRSERNEFGRCCDGTYNLEAKLRRGVAHSSQRLFLD